MTGSVTTWTDYLFAGGGRVGARSMVVGGATTLRYYVTDHLGSVAIVTDGAGAVAERRSFDAWGKSRNTNGTDDPAGAIDLGHAAPTRGFTDHEHMPSVGLVNMNARVYDPELGRFLSADSVVPSIFFSQALNRYAYVDNNPLSLTDPTGQVPEILIIGYTNPVTAVVSVVLGGLLKSIFGGLFGAKKAALIVQQITVASGPSPYSAVSGGSPTGIPHAIFEGIDCGGGPCEIVVTGAKTGAVAANSAPAVTTLTAMGVPEIVINGIRECPTCPDDHRLPPPNPDTRLEYPDDTKARILADEAYRWGGEANQRYHNGPQSESQRRADLRKYREYQRNLERYYDMDAVSYETKRYLQGASRYLFDFANQDYVQLVSVNDIPRLVMEQALDPPIGGVERPATPADRAPVRIPRYAATPTFARPYSTLDLVPRMTRFLCRPEVEPCY